MDHQAKPSLSVVKSVIIGGGCIRSILTRTALLALRLSHSTARMACDVEFLDGMRPAVGLLLVGDLHVLLGLVGFITLSSALGCTRLSPSTSQHSSALCIVTVLWLIKLMSARYHSNGCALNRV